MHEYPFYKYMFEPKLAAKNPTLAFMGYLRTVGPHLPPVELQARYATLVFTVRCIYNGCKGILIVRITLYFITDAQGERKLPSEKTMWSDINERRRRAFARFHQNHDSHSGLVECDGVPFDDELAALIGCEPPLGEVATQSHCSYTSLTFSLSFVVKFDALLQVYVRRVSKNLCMCTVLYEYTDESSNDRVVMTRVLCMY